MISGHAHQREIQIGRRLDQHAHRNPRQSSSKNPTACISLDIMRAQWIYNNSRWPNPVVVNLTAVEPAAH